MTIHILTTGIDGTRGEFCGVPRGATVEEHREIAERLVAHGEATEVRLVRTRRGEAAEEIGRYTRGG